MRELNEMGCDELAGVAAELAFGVLTGRGRAEALAHLDQCEACREGVRRLTVTGEEFLGLLPSSEPPPGFETRVMERIGLAAPGTGTSGRAGRKRHLGRNLSREGTGQVSRTRRMPAVAAVALAVLGTGLGGWGLRAATSSPAGSPLSSAALLSASRQSVGKIFVYSRGQGWMYMSVDMTSGDGTVLCQVLGRDGQVTTAGSFWLAGGHGSWGSPEPPGAGPPAGARLISADGTVLATASFPGN
jgi:hypothetical protein